DVRNYGLWEFKVQANAGAYASNIYFSNYGEVLNTGPGSASISRYQGHAGSNLHMQQSGMTIYASIDIQYGNWQIDATCSILVFAVNAGEYVKFGGAKIVNNGGFYGRIAFAGSNETILEGNGHYEHVEIAKTGDVVSLAGSPEVKQAFTLTSGRIVLNQYDLRLGSANLDYSNGFSSYIETNGTGSCVLNCPVGDFAVYPIGNSEFTPFAILLAQGSTSDLIKVRVSDSFYGEYTGSNPACSEQIPVGVVRQNWFVSEQTPGGSLATLVAYWEVGAERNGFDRSNCTLGQYINSNWQNNGFRPAVDVSSLHGFFGFNFTSFGIFGVYDSGHEGDVNFVTPAPDGNTPVCEWDELQLHANTSSNAEVEWSGPNGFQSNAPDPIVPGIQLSQGGIYTAYASQYGCPEKHASVTVQVNAEPTASVLGPDHIQQGESAVLTAYGGTSFLWSTSETLQSITVAPTQTTDYVVTVSNAAGCTTTVLHTVQVSGASATHDAEGAIGKMKIAPNPASDNTLLMFESATSGEWQLSVTDARGVQLFRKNLAITSGPNQVTISLADFPAGTYQVTLLRESEVKTIRVLKLMGE
ncbi:MAG: T9SS type A sorting domain-containing protein, partial [Saprospiraceae bacterium]